MTPDLADLRFAGTGATVPGGYPWWLVEAGHIAPFPTVTAPHQAAEFVADRVAEGSDYLKVLIDDGVTTGRPTPTLRSDTVRALTDATHAHDRLAIAHTLRPPRDRFRRRRAGPRFRVRPRRAEPPRAHRRPQRLRIPTLAALYELFGRPQGKAMLSDPRIEPHLDQASRAGLAWGEIPLEPDARNDLDLAVETVGRLRDAGVTLLAGSDANGHNPVHGASLHRDLELLVAAGLTAEEALTAATAAPASCYGLTDRGRIAPGLRADLLLVRGDPTRNITATLDIEAVWRGGHRIGKKP